MDADVATLRNNFLSPPNLLNPVSERNFWDRLAMTTPVKLSYFKKQRSGQLCPILLPLFSSTFHESDKLHDREKKFERRQRRRRSKLGGLEAFSPRKCSIEGLGNAISRAFRRSFSVNKCEEKCASSIFFTHLLKGGNFIYPMMHCFILCQAFERTWSYQSNNSGKRRVSPIKPPVPLLCRSLYDFCFTIPNISFVKSKKVFWRTILVN